jgi:HEPN domain-containing protein
MNDLTREWIGKAEGDFATAGREVRARKQPNYDAACFHAQQAAEKYLKAILQESGAPIPRTHNLIDLLGLCLPHDNSLALQRDLIVVLDRYAVLYRYPGDSADKEEARSAYRAISELRQFMQIRFAQM